MQTLIFVFIALTVVQTINSSHTKNRKCNGKYVCKRQNWFRRSVCIDLAQFCNGVTECPLGEDEVGCNTGDSLKCLACKGVKTVDECQEVVKCTRDEVACYMVTYLSDSNETLVDYGFAKSESCPVNEGPLVFGPPIEDNIQCTKCCVDGEYCNRQLNCTAPGRFSRECSYIKNLNASANSGVYIIYPDGTFSSAVAAYCEMSDPNAWTVFQRRLNGSVDFYRGWATYKHGFGTPFGEYWLGIDVLHELTTYAVHELRVEFADFEGNTNFAQYTMFSVGNESSEYVATISGFSGNVAYDALSGGDQPINNREFSTYDRDNDRSSGNCAENFKGAWWYNDCHRANLNGAYLAGQHASIADGVNWFSWTYSLKTVTMMVRKSDNN